MNMDVFWHLAAIFGSVVGGTWVLRSKLSDLEMALKAHASSVEAKFEGLTARVIKMERRRR